MLVPTTTPLERGLASYASRRWTDAYESLVEPDQGAALCTLSHESHALHAHVSARTRVDDLGVIKKLLG